tara:strand:+ start:41 stop:793 length:753 start_codon:yes stop_codon:yes gene_type:complete
MFFNPPPLFNESCTFFLDKFGTYYSICDLGITDSENICIIEEKHFYFVFEAWCGDKGMSPFLGKKDLMRHLLFLYEKVISNLFASSRKSLFEVKVSEIVVLRFNYKVLFLLRKMIYEEGNFKDSILKIRHREIEEESSRLTAFEKAVFAKAKDKKKRSEEKKKSMSFAPETANFVKNPTTFVEKEKNKLLLKKAFNSRSPPNVIDVSNEVEIGGKWFCSMKVVILEEVLSFEIIPMSILPKNKRTDKSPC